MRTILITALFAGLSSPAWAAEPLMEGPVVGGSFGMSGADYYGDVRDRMPFTREAAPQPIGIRDMERVRAARRRADLAARHAAPRRHLQQRHAPQG